MSLTRAQIEDDVLAYLYRNPAERRLILPLLQVIRNHRHGPDVVCSDCPVLMTGAVVVSNILSVLHFFHPPTESWVLREDDVDPTSEGMLSSALKGLENATGLKDVWIGRGGNGPLAITVSFIRANPEKNLPTQLCYSFKYLFRASSEIPLKGYEWGVARWIPLHQVRNLELRRRIVKATRATR
ncbi:hypothetical protein ACIOEX_20610 [Streptomyces sp. NPDC087850]|uniref:hypothetical protein n=1 Tax=Streptomyces sp. NPDC087850 TaxID=3365809 RepID=UPI0038253333